MTLRGRGTSRGRGTHTDDIVMFDVPLPLQSRGLADYRKTWELFFANNRGGVGSFDVADLHVTASDTVAIATRC